jgi:GntR family transcriptional repressor for pyruvate dehydrogenase complex
MPESVRLQIVDGQDGDRAIRSLGFSDLTRDRLYEQIADRLQEMIVTRGLHPGDRLPPERELCGLFGVSRTVIREATKVLAARGLVSIEVGRGTFIADGTGQAALESLNRHFRADQASLRELHEARMIMEPNIAALAARHIDAAGEERLRTIMARLATSVDDAEAWLRTDQEFHQALAEISGNRVLLMFITSIVDLLQHARRLSLSRWETMDEAVAMHRDILEAVLARDTEAARWAMQRHIERVGETIFVAGEEGDT